MMDDNTLENIIFGLKQTIAEQQAEIERLKNFIDFKTANVMCDKCKWQAVKDTAKEIFTELLKGENVCEEVVKDYYGGDYIMSAVTVDKIRELAKEKYGVEVE